jgi:predicted methyltransferase
MQRHICCFIVSLSFAAAPSAAGLDGALPLAISAAVADSHRPAEQTRLDAQRKPAQLMSFSGVKPGDSVADFMPGNAYFTRILSKIVGPEGRIYAFIPQEEVENCEPAEIAGSRAIEHDPLYRNVVQLSGPVNRFSPPQPLDVLWISQNYHDLHDAFLGPADIRAVTKAFFNSLKPGGTLIVVDHVAAPGSGLRDTESLHRIDPDSVRNELQSAGFVFEAQIHDLDNPNDDHSRPVFDPLIRGKTDQFVYKFRRPATPLARGRDPRVIGCLGAGADSRRGPRKW